MPFIKLPKPRPRVQTTKKKDYQEIYQDKRWRLIRAQKMRSNPLCEYCEDKNRVTAAVEVHHVIPFDWGRGADEKQDLAFDYDNTKSVCEACHEAAHILLKLEKRGEVLNKYFKY